VYNDVERRRPTRNRGVSRGFRGQPSSFLIEDQYQGFIQGGILGVKTPLFEKFF